MTLIGGHLKQPTSDGPGLDVLRTPEGIVKRAYTEGDRLGIHNEARFLKVLEGTHCAPRLLRVEDNYIVQEDLGTSEEVKDGEAFRRNAIRLLWNLRNHNIRHGDLTYSNVIIRDDFPIAIDFQQSNLLYGEEPPQKRPLSDSYYLWRWISQTPAKEHPTPDTPRVIRRWLAILGALDGLAPDSRLAGKTLLDLGCFQGDFCAIAAADGMASTGVDMGGFQQGGDSIAVANELWAEMACTFYKTNIMYLRQECDFEYDAVLLFSTWAYIYNDYGQDAAYRLLRRIMEQCGSLFFETQLEGDGPGQQYLVTDDDVGSMLGQFGVPHPLVTIPVTGRPASRTVWQVKPK